MDAPAAAPGSDLSDLLRRARAGQPLASKQLFDVTYADLKRMAHSRLKRSGGRGELDTTSLVHESFLRLVEQRQLQTSERAAFFGYAARVMRSVVIDHVRRERALKRGGDETIVTLTTGVERAKLDDERLLALHAALETLERVAPEFHELAELRYFSGLSLREIAELRAVSLRSLEREWEKARAFLRKLLHENSSFGDESDEEVRRAGPGPRSG